MSEFSETDEYFMKQALAEAEAAADNNEVPIGCVIVKDGEIIGRGGNRKIENKTAFSHAEIMAITDASDKNGDWRLDGCTMYVTLEPCLMCAGAIIHSRIKRVVFAAREPKFGGVVTLANTFDTPGLNHKVSYEEGLFADKSSEILKKYFKRLRGRQ